MLLDPHAPLHLATVQAVDQPAYAVEGQTNSHVVLHCRQNNQREWFEYKPFTNLQGLIQQTSSAAEVSKRKTGNGITKLYSLRWHVCRTSCTFYGHYTTLYSAMSQICKSSASFIACLLRHAKTHVPAGDLWCVDIHVVQCLLLGDECCPKLINKFHMNILA